MRIIRASITKLKQLLSVKLQVVSRPKYLWLQFLGILIFAITIPILILGIILTRTSKEAFSTSVKRDHLQLVMRSANEIDLFLSKPLGMLQLTAQILGVAFNEPWRQETILVELITNYPQFVRALLLDKEGKIIARSSTDWHWNDKFKQEAFSTSLPGNNFVSEVFISSGYLPHTIIGTPVKQAGNITGVLIAEVNIREMWDIIDRIRLGETGHAYLITSSGRIIAHPDRKKVLWQENVNNTTFWEEIKGGGTGTTEYADQTGRKWIASYAPISSLGWKVVLEQALDEAYSFFHKMKLTSHGMIIVGEIAAIITSILIARFLTHPIRELVAGTRKVASGDLDYQINSPRRDEIGTLSHSFDEMTRRLKKIRDAEKLATLGTLATSIAHEIKNPLALIKMLTFLLPRRFNDPKFREKFSRIVPSEIERMDTILSSLLNFARPEPLKFSLLNIEEIINDVQTLASNEFSQRGVKIIYHPSPNIPVIIGDADKLKQVFMNIILNALDAMDQGGILTITTKMLMIDRSDLEIPGHYLEIALSDTGSGIKKENQEAIFEAFFTTKVKGCGLGLAVSKKIVDEHSGYIEIDSEPGKGTTFRIGFPINE